jgi:hypothetical protein
MPQIIGGECGNRHRGRMDVLKLVQYHPTEPFDCLLWKHGIVL